MSELLHKFSVKGKPQEGYTLLKDGVPVRCHKMMPFPTNGPLGGTPQLQFLVLCSTSCGRANLYKDSHAGGVDEYWFEQSCEGCAQRFLLANKPDQEGETASKGLLV